ncbi:MAG: ZIP family metal transporter [Holophagales bacterium]|nr:ZIP family metal transporter [Holophagales bacterium]
MHTDSVYALIPLACLATLFGGWLVVHFLYNRVSIMRHISGAAAGYLASATIVRIMPEALRFGGDAMALWAMGGFLFVHIIEYGITPHFHYGEESHDHEGTAMTGVMALLGLSLHSFLDGMTITAAMRTESALGMLVFLGVLLHRIPEGATISSIFLVRGFGSRGALFAAGTLTVTALLGALSQDLFELPVGPVLAVAAGLGLYVACVDLLPQAQKESGWKSTVSLAAGVLIFVAANYLLPHEHEHGRENEGQVVGAAHTECSREHDGDYSSDAHSGHHSHKH